MGKEKVGICSGCGLGQNNKWIGRLQWEHLWEPQGMWAGERKSCHGVFCCGTWDETGGLHLGEQGKKRKSACILPVFLACPVG